MNSVQFDWKFYVNYYQDLRAAGINTEQLAKKHWNLYGRRENRLPNGKGLRVSTGNDLIANGGIPRLLPISPADNRSDDILYSKILLVYVYYERPDEQKNQLQF